jgi:dihydrofolate reductase
MIIALVVAAAENGVIGNGGKLPWRLAGDMRLFKSITMGKPVIMGRKTWDSLPRKPLPGRLNIVMTRDPDFTSADATVAGGVDDAIKAAGLTGQTEACVIGGGELYRRFLPLAQRIYLTRISGTPSGDTLFPLGGISDWREVQRQPIPPSEGDTVTGELAILERH